MDVTDGSDCRCEKFDFAETLQRKQTKLDICILEIARNEWCSASRKYAQFTYLVRMQF